MKIKRFLSLFIAVVLCLSSFTAFAEEIVMEYSPFDEYVDYSNMYFWSRWNNGDEKPADLFFVCPTVDMGKESVLELYSVHISYDILRQNLLINSLIEIKKIAIRSFCRNMVKYLNFM